MIIYHNIPIVLKFFLFKYMNNISVKELLMHNKLINHYLIKTNFNK